MQLLILFCLQTDLMNHSIFSEFAGIFLFILNYMVTTLQFLKFWFLHLVITFFVSLAPIIVMVPGDCCFYVYCVNVHFHRKKMFSHASDFVLFINTALILAIIHLGLLRISSQCRYILQTSIPVIFFLFSFVVIYSLNKTYISLF